MSESTIKSVAKSLEADMERAEDAQAAVEARLREIVGRCGPAKIVALLESAVPAGASVGELVVYRSSKLTLLYGRIPPHFRSAIHDHTVFACIAQLTGQETSVVYEPEGDGLRVAQTTTGRPGDVVSLPADAIHHIENPTDGVSAALHVYGGDFDAVREQRSLWSHEEHVRGEFTFEKLLVQSVDAMKQTGNQAGLNGLVEAIPAAKALVANG